MNRIKRNFASIVDLLRIKLKWLKGLIQRQKIQTKLVYIICIVISYLEVRFYYFLFINVILIYLLYYVNLYFSYCRKLLVSYTCGVCETILVKNELRHHPCFDPYNNVYIDDNLYIYPQCGEY